MNQVSLVGRITQELELKNFEDGNCVTRFNLAIDRYLKSTLKAEKKSEGRQTADFPRIVLWGKQAENCCKYLKKGALISINGRVNTTSYEKADGETAYVTEIVGEKVHFLESQNVEHKK